MIRLTLPSDSSSSYFPNNTAANFNVKLANSINLTDEWEIGINEIIFPNQMCNIRKNENEVAIYRKNVDGSAAAQQSSINFPKRIIYLPPGYYRTVPEIVKYINSKFGYVLPKKNKFFLLKYDSKLNRVTVIPTRNYGVHFGGDIRQILGFSSSKKALNYSNHYVNFIKRKGDFHSSIKRSINSMLIYSDIVNESVVGDVMAPILRIVTISKDAITGEGSTSITYDPVYYYPLKFNQFDTINIQLLDQKGELVQFESGDVVLIVTLKKKLYKQFASKNISFIK